MFSKKKAFLFLSRLLISIIILLGILIGVKSNSSFKEKFYKEVFDTNISFAQINKLYEKYAGSSLPFKDLFAKQVEPVFNEKLNYSEKETYLDGVKLFVDTNYLIPAIDEGIVIFVGEKKGYGNTIIIGQSNGIDTWYCNVDNLVVKLYDNIQKGSLIGNSNGDYFYLVFKKNGESLNYEDYI